MMQFGQLVKSGWLSCPGCDSHDLYMYNDKDTWNDVIGCRECGVKNTLFWKDSLVDLEDTGHVGDDQ